MRKRESEWVTWIYLKSLRDKSNRKVNEILTVLSATYKGVYDLLNYEDDNFKVDCDAIDGFCKIIYDPEVFFEIQRIRSSFFKFLKSTRTKNKNTIKELLNDNEFNFYFAHHITTLFYIIWKNSLKSKEAKKVIEKSKDIEWNVNILLSFLYCIIPWELDNELLEKILKFDSRILSDIRIIWLLFEKIWKDRITKTHVSKIFNAIPNFESIPDIDWVISKFNLIKLF